MKGQKVTIILTEENGQLKLKMEFKPDVKAGEPMPMPVAVAMRMLDVVKEMATPRRDDEELKPLRPSRPSRFKK